MTTHQEIDQRSLAMHCLVADKVRRDEQLLDKAREILSRWRQTASPRTFGYLDEWQSLLDQGTQACLKVATENSEHASALRQASPLACLLKPRERFDFLKNWKQHHAAR